MISAIGRLVLHLNAEAAEESRIELRDETADQVLDALRRGYRSRFYGKAKELTAGIIAGLELRQGDARSAEAKTIRQGTLNRLKDYALFMRAVDELEYTPQLLRAALSYHYPQLRSAELGSDANCLLMDIEQAAARLNQKQRKAETPTPSEVIDLLAGGLGPQEIGARYKTNGSRLVGRVLKQLSLELGDGRCQSPTRQSVGNR